MSYRVVAADGAELAREVDGETAAHLVAQAAPGASVRRGLVELYRNTERVRPTAKLLEFRSKCAEYPHPCSIYGVVSWREGLRFGRLLRWCIRLTMTVLLNFETPPSGAHKTVLGPGPM